MATMIAAVTAVMARALVAGITLGAATGAVAACPLVLAAGVAVATKGIVLGEEEGESIGGG